MLPRILLFLMALVTYQATQQEILQTCVYGDEMNITQAQRSPRGCK